MKILYFALIATLIYSCSNEAAKKPLTDNSALTELIIVTPPPTPGSQESDPNYTVTEVKTTTSTPKMFVLNLAATGTDQKQKPSLLEKCDSASSCHCFFQWEELNRDTNQKVPRTIDTEIKTLQAYHVECSPPPLYDIEIGSDPSIALKVSIVGRSSKNSNFKTKPVIYTPTNNDNQFPDFTEGGITLLPIYRYTCYDLLGKGSIKNQYNTDSSTDLDGGVHMSSNRFRLTSRSIAEPSEYSRESYYYNLYSSYAQKGKLSQHNLRFICPSVTPMLKIHQGNDTNNLGLWPMDTSFALSQTTNSEFNLPVQANSMLGLDGQIDSASTDCTGNVISASSSTSISYQCIGFAKRPKPDGSCEPTRLPNGYQIKNYRLRRFFMRYPTRYDVTGLPVKETSPTDFIYVLDREVSNGTNPFNMQGPKPCPFAFRDPIDGIYRSSTSTKWNYRNVDNLSFINSDLLGANESCASILPLTNYAANTLGTDGTDNPVGLNLVLTHRNFTSSTLHTKVREATMLGLYTSSGSELAWNLSNVPIRPRFTPWYPRYEEDLSFEACAPKPRFKANDILTDPPLYIYKKNNTNPPSTESRWCAVVHPTANGAIGGPTVLDPASNPSISSRVFTPSDAKFKNFPISASSASIFEDVLKTDPSFDCNITTPWIYPSTPKRIPSSGCCQNLSSIDTKTAIDAVTNSKCVTPNY